MWKVSYQRHYDRDAKI
jgi:hypothetical protein